MEYAVISIGHYSPCTLQIFVCTERVGLISGTVTSWFSESQTDKQEATFIFKRPWCRISTFDSMPVMDEAFVTLATNDVYSQGALVVGQCLRRHGTSRQTVVMVGPHVSQGERAALARVFHHVKEVDVLDSSDRAHLTMMGRPELGVTLTKLHCWALTQYTKCVFLDADTLVLCNVDELFDREELSAAPDPGWPDCFNSGVFVFRPSLQTHDRLLQWAREHGSFDGGDQGLLNSFFSDWATQDISKHLPFIYNLSTSAVYTYLPAFQQYGGEAKIVHFLGAVKPWHCKYDRQTGEVTLRDGAISRSHLGLFLNLWWVEYCQHVVPSFMETDTCQESGRHNQKESRVQHPDHSSRLLLAAPAEAVSQAESKACVLAYETESVEVTLNEDPHCMPQKEDLSLYTEKSFTPTAPNEMRTKPEDTPPGDEGGASEWTHPHDPPPNEESGASESGIFERSQSGEPPLELTASISELAVHLKPEEDDLERRRRWEEGRADYLGEDAFDNIKKKLDKFLK
ncbi:hypothetical protein AAFF_G00008320 [Aldrovandia affinis]|uniref:glycogenin glucosyltransferase n=1 Tax=Aldrovandia affinis TaxID=143900 RepID=A0AAD7T658_9TELE|nr:hypothetical protein AAFF_G00008320 [Aldrovandia affinis]